VLTAPAVSGRLAYDAVFLFSSGRSALVVPPPPAFAVGPNPLSVVLLLAVRMSSSEM
jgi:hypothetical protein